MPEEKKVPEKKVPVKAERAIARRHVPSRHVITTFDDMLEDFGRRFRESIWMPWEPFEIEPVREAYSDLVDAGNKYLVHAEVPGIPKNKINITVTKDNIEISAETEVATEEKGENFVVRERGYSTIYKRLPFPEEVIPDKAEAALKDGLLEVSVPKKTPTPEPKKHKVELK